MAQHPATISLNHSRWFKSPVTFKPNCTYLGLAYQRTALNLQVRVSFDTDHQTQIRNVKVGEQSVGLNDMLTMDFVILENNTTATVLIGDPPDDWADWGGKCEPVERALTRSIEQMKAKGHTKEEVLKRYGFTEALSALIERIFG